MEQSIQHAVTTTLDYLVALTREGTRPDAAISGLRPLQQENPDLDLQLVWEQDVFDERMHYDALLTLPGHGTISMSYCADGAKPWPLRGVQRWSDKNLLRVNDTVMEIGQAIQCIDFIWDDAHITDRLVNACLINEELGKHPISVSPDELQAAMDGFRKARRLFKAEDTYNWMAERGMTHHALEQLVKGQAVVIRLRDRLVSDGVAAYFAAHCADFDTVRIARFSVSDEATARRVCERIRSEETALYEEAARQFLASNPLRPPANLFATLRRRDAPAELRDILFTSDAGSVLDPVRERNGYGIIRILSKTRAVLDDVTAESIRESLFDEWLKKRRQSAAIEWFWGNAARTSGAMRSTPDRPADEL